MAIPKSGDRPENDMNIQQNPETGKYRIEGRKDLGEADTAEELQNRLQKQPNSPRKPSKRPSQHKPSTGGQQPTKAVPLPPVPSEQPTQPTEQGGVPVPPVQNHEMGETFDDADGVAPQQEGLPQEYDGEQVAPDPEYQPVAADNESIDTQEPPVQHQSQDENVDRPAQDTQSPDDLQPAPAAPQDQPQPTPEGKPEPARQGSEQESPQQQSETPPPQHQAQAQPVSQKKDNNDAGEKSQNSKEQPNTNLDLKKNRVQDIRKSNAMRNPKTPMGSLKDTAKEKAKEVATDAAKDTKAGEAASKAVEVADKAKNAFGAIKAGVVKVKTLIPILANPYFWIASLVIVVLLAVTLFVMAGPQVIGRDDNRRVCLDENSINNQIGTMSAADARGRAQEIGDYLTSTHFEPLGGPMTVTQAAAFIGNLMVETGGTLNPSVKQGGDTSDMSNSEVRAWSGGRSGRAIGIVQWDVGRALQLIDFAESKGAKWNDLELQVEFFTHEINGSEGNGVRNALSQLESSDIETVTLAWDRAFWRSAGYHGQERVGHAVEFLEYYEQGAHSGTHGVTICNDHNLVSMDASNIVDLAISIAITSGRIEDSHVPSFGFDIFGDAVAPEAYKEANALAFENGGADPYAGGRPVYASCDRFVATVLKASKTDVDVPWGSTGEQLNHYRASDKWEHVTTVTTGEDPVAKGAEAGDVLIRVGHTALYLGTPENATEIGLSPGVPAVADASIMRRVGFVRPFAYMDSPSQRYEVFRCVKDCGEDTLEDVA